MYLDCAGGSIAYIPSNQLYIYIYRKPTKRDENFFHEGARKKTVSPNILQMTLIASHGVGEDKNRGSRIHPNRQFDNYFFFFS